MIIGRLRGEVAAIGADTVLIDVNGVGYVAQAGSRLLSRLDPGQRAELHIETKITENSITLYAFETDEARAWFARLQDVPGVGGKAAMALLDALTPGELMDAIALGDVASVTRAKGVGKKLAERIVGELAGKAPPMGRFGSFGVKAAPGLVSAAGAPAGGARAEAISALQNLGYGPTDAARAVAAAAKANEGADTPALIKAALKELMPS
ncbi:MAG: Holliday junction branch migration protein RuvA [Hyphomonadaceae bacterium]|nr:Holliday junction branch migration protein RuvA [Hyphomonadaceae bacterium]